MTTTLTSAELKPVLRTLYDDYAACIDEFELTKWPEFFTDDCVYQVVSRENYERKLPHATIWCGGIAMLVDRGAAILKTAVFERRWQQSFISGLRIVRLNDGVVEVQTKFLVIESLIDQPPHIAMVGRSFDKLRLDAGLGGSMKFTERICVFDNHAVTTSLVLPL